jgi:DNA (cytosine-5)-methyltransferase 1
MKEIRYFSMFAGIGGFEYAMQQSKHNFKCVGFCEINKFAESIYKKHFPNHINYGDATKIRTETIPRFDLLVAGFPCQAFSNAGKKQGFNDTRGTLFFEIARILKDKRPRYFLFENVAGLLHHQNGKTFQRILGILSELDYDVECEIFNSREFVPQNRVRIFLKGYFRNECGEEIFHFRRNYEESYLR